ncbi:MAG: BadF/BadG/BcrA/BcrD ATPase family protein, partial [Syntrophomonadaceae bacterium]|nr:BadF/BadG/BcrA/BcrD ATPase family protein [Syntrophomonadaceae bacterium]
MERVKSLGICIGASTVSVAMLEVSAAGGVEVTLSTGTPHEGDPRRALATLLEQVSPTGTDFLAVTGRKFRSLLAVASLSEPEAVEYAYGWAARGGAKPGLLISAGGETIIAYRMDRHGKICDVVTGNKCAAGTGEFFLQQLRRMDVELEEAVASADLDNPHRVSGRCSVFCKSDCTHALNKGAARERVIAGLCEMMAARILELVRDNTGERVMMVGGMTENTAVVELVRRRIPHLEIPACARTFEAVGAALWALEQQQRAPANLVGLFAPPSRSFACLEPLAAFADRVRFHEPVRSTARAGDECVLGLDVGSTTTKAVVVRRSDLALLASCYLRTNGDPVGAARKCYRQLNDQVGDLVRLVGLGVTGSGRQIAGLHALTAGVVNEIVAHAAAAVHFDAGV